MSEIPDFSVVVPAFNEVESLPELVDRIEAVFAKSYSPSRIFEILIVDDGSSDGSADLLVDMAAAKPHLKPVLLRTNVGKSLALNIGFKRVSGEIVLTLDADLQDNPENIPALVAKLEEGYDVVGGRRGSERQDSMVRKLGSKMFNGVVRKQTGLQLQDLNCGIKAYRAEVVKTLVLYSQFHRYLPLLSHFLGFRVTELPVKNSKRKYGESRYPTFRYQGLFDLITILFLNKYLLSPMHFFAKVSAIFLIPSSVTIIYLVARHVLWLVDLGEAFILVERPLLSISLGCFLAGLLIFLTGFVCEFMLYHSIQNRLEGIGNAFIKQDGTAHSDDRRKDDAT